MKQEAKSFQSMHEYLDTLFKNIHPTKEQIIQAKQEYRKNYQQYYQREYQANHIQISFRVTKLQYKNLQEVAQSKKLKVTTLAKQSVLKGKVNTTLPLKRLILQLIDVIEESIYENYKLDLEEVLSILKTVEEKL
tara:strand:+ start:105385 stop:105789 length:405 start_codon:yes stop_codon:yes gene_type:complete